MIKAFAVILCARKIRVPCLGANVEPPGDDIIGFFATRKVWAKDKESAIKAAREGILKEWIKGGYEAVNQGSPPEFSVDRVTELKGFPAMFRKIPSRGFIFFPRE